MSDIPSPDIEAVKEFIDMVKDYGDGESDTSFFDGPGKTCKRRRGQHRQQGDDVEITVAYPHPLSEEDKERMATLSRAYWAAVGMEPPVTRNKQTSGGDHEHRGNSFEHSHEEHGHRHGSDEEHGKHDDGKIYFEKVIAETDEKIVEEI
jgi:hypothetical protein